MVLSVIKTVRSMKKTNPSISKDLVLVSIESRKQAEHGLEGSQQADPEGDARTLARILSEHSDFIAKLTKTEDIRIELDPQVPNKVSISA